MCGLCGVALDDPAGSPDPGALLLAARTLALRGPDDEGVHVLGSAAIAFRRLSIIDVSGGHQPIENEARDIAMVLNGEIYNHHELRRELQGRGHRFRTGSDVEVFVHLYEECGERAVERLVGMFAFALIDLRDRARPRVLLGRDRLGIKPLYWAKTRAGIAFASEPKAILAMGDAQQDLGRRLSREALLEYLMQGYVGGARSAWEGIERLPAAHTLTFEPGAEPRIRRYWDLPLESLRDSGPAETLDREVLEWLDRVVLDHLQSDVPLGAFLSGGVDSNAVVDSMARAGVDPLVACSVGFRSKTHDELDLARASAARLGARHHTEVLDPDPRLVVDTLPWVFDEPLADPSTLPTFLVSKMARAHVTVALSGDGGDEVFGGYRRYVHDHAENRLRARLGPAGRRAAGILGRAWPKLDWAPRPLRGRTFLTNLDRDPARAYYHSVSQLSREEALLLLDPELARSLAGSDPFERFAEHYERPRVDDPLYRAQYADIHTYLPDQILTKVDRASMAVSLEVRPPLLDHRFVERFVVLPAAEKVRRGSGKFALRRALGPRLPPQILDGAKRGFDTPLDRWLRGPLQEFTRESLQTLPADWFSRKVLEERLAEHLSGRRSHARLLWSLLVLEHWRRAHSVRGLSP